MQGSLCYILFRYTGKFMMILPYYPCFTIYLHVLIFTPCFFLKITCSRGCNSERRADVHPFWQRRYGERLDSEQQKCLLNYVFLGLDCSDSTFWSLFFLGGILVFKYGGSTKREKCKGQDISILCEFIPGSRRRRTLPVIMSQKHKWGLMHLFLR